MGEVKCKRRQWTQREVNEAIKMYHDGMNFTEIGRQLNRNKTSVNRKLVALKIHKVEKKETVYLWDIESVRGNIIDVDEAKKTTRGSSKKILFKCSTDGCDTTKRMRPYTLINKGFACPTCSTGTSYPELFMLAVNQHFNLGYEHQQAYENGRFDFINHDTRTVVEMNGMAHYEEVNSSTWKDAHSKTVISDNKKRKWCKENNYTLIFIDARESTFEFIMDNINKCKLLPTITDEDIPKLLDVIEQNKKYPVKEIIEMYLRARKSTVEIAEHYGYDVSTIGNILRKNNVELRGNNTSQGKKVRCIETGIVYASTHEAGRKLEINRGNITSCLIGNRKSAGGYHFEYLSDIESNAMHRAQLVAEQDKLDTIELDSSIDLAAMLSMKKV